MSLAGFAELHIGPRGEVLPFLDDARVTKVPRIANKRTRQHRMVEAIHSIRGDAVEGRSG